MKTPIKVNEPTVEAFANLFRGRTDVGGSVEGRANKEKVTLEHYRRHLVGDTSLGVYMMQDDNTCRFFAIDYDVHDLSTVLKIRQAFRDKGLPVYLAASKSKGNHLYGFAGKEPFPAADIRRACISILSGLGIECEVFPKQDKLDEVTPYGNYINLPSYGHTRKFLRGDLKEVPIEEVVKQIKHISGVKLQEVIRTLPPPKMLKLKRARNISRKDKPPPCIEEIMKGMTQPGSDLAAFALARHFLDHHYTKAEVLALLITWDGNNTPPFNDTHLLEAKVHSAAKGYVFGCSSIYKRTTIGPFLC